MRRVLLLIKGLGRGGAEQLLVNAAPYLDRRRFSYEVAYLLPWKDALVGDLEAVGLTVHQLGRGRGAGWLPQVRRLVRDREIDLVHVHSPYAAIGARVALAGRHRPRIVYTEHNLWPRYRGATYWGNLLTYPANDHVFAVSGGVADSVAYPRALRWLPMPAVETLHHGPDPAMVATWGDGDGVRAELGLPDDAPVIGTVGNLKVAKGHVHLIRAIALLRHHVPDVRAVLVGQGPEEARLREEIATLGLTDHVVLAGFRDDAPRVTAAFDVFVLSSLYEGLPISLLEALALGKPAVLTAVGGIPEVVQHGREALLVPAGDAQALADTLRTLLSDDALRARLGAAARRRGADFDIGDAVRRSEALYEEVLA